MTICRSAPARSVKVLTKAAPVVSYSQVLIDDASIYDLYLQFVDELKLEGFSDKEIAGKTTFYSVFKERFSHVRISNKGGHLCTCSVCDDLRVSDGRGVAVVVI